MWIRFGGVQLKWKWLFLVLMAESGPMWVVMPLVVVDRDPLFVSEHGRVASTLTSARRFETSQATYMYAARLVYAAHFSLSGHFSSGNNKKKIAFITSQMSIISHLGLFWVQVMLGMLFFVLMTTKRIVIASAVHLLELRRKKHFLLHFCIEVTQCGLNWSKIIGSVDNPRIISLTNSLLPGRVIYIAWWR